MRIVTGMPVGQALRLDVLDADLAPCDELVVVVVGADLDVPELIRGSLDHWYASNTQTPRAVGAHDLGDVAHPDDLLSGVLNGQECTDRREGFDRRAVEAAVDQSPRVVVALVGPDRPADTQRRRLVKVGIDQPQEFAAVQRGGRFGCHAHCLHPLTLAAGASAARGADVPRHFRAFRSAVLNAIDVSKMSAPLWPPASHRAR